MKLMINMTNPTVVDEDDCLKKADNMNAKLSCHNKK